MRRGGAPSLRKTGFNFNSPAVTNVKSNEEILAMLGSNSSSPKIVPPCSSNYTEQNECVSSSNKPNNFISPIFTGQEASSPIKDQLFRQTFGIKSYVKDVSSQSSLTVSDTNDKTYSYFTCVWCKKSGRKHKKWEGDGWVRVGARSLLVIDEDGKEIGRGSGYKAQELLDLEEGKLLSLGSKEIEISGAIDQDEWQTKFDSGKENSKKENISQPEPKSKKRKADFDDKDDNFEVVNQPSPESKVMSILKHANTKPFQIPRRTGSESASKMAISARIVQPGISMYDPNREGALVMPRPPAGHSLHTNKMVDVVVDPYIGDKLRPHQRSGVLFIYKSLMQFTSITVDDAEFKVKGCILADDMGLGKTLQTISVIWTLLKQSPIAGSSLARKVLIVAPASLINNWEAEFKKWLGTTRILVHVADNAKKVTAFKAYRTAPVLVVSYEMLVRAEAQLKEVKWDILVCDEAHRLKNSEIKTSAALNRFDCDRKLLLTGTPVQNDLQEYFCLISIVVPSLLGSKASFTADYVKKIEQGRDVGADENDAQEAESALKKLSEISRKILLRRTSEIISGYLPPKTTCVVFCRPSDFQCKVYGEEVSTLYDKIETEHASHLASISTLKKICNSPFLLQHLNVNGGPNTWEEQSGKLSVLTCLLLSIMQNTDEKIVLVSLSTSTLDILESLCSKYNLRTLRLDGKTPPAARQSIVNRFNKPDYAERVFLLSSKAGGTGLNLIGASRIVLYDIDWNPATDLQVMSRIWRSGQKRHCYIYRLLTTGTIEEKVYQRQVMKSGLAGGLETASWQDVGSASHFSPEELRDLFTFRTDTESDTHDLLGCECGGSGDLPDNSDGKEERTERACQLGAVQSVERGSHNIEKLMQWRHITSPIYGKISDDCLAAAESFVSFLFLNYQDSDSQDS